jgi:XTP/dITP diphosphohydrolase
MSLTQERSITWAWKERQRIVTILTRLSGLKMNMKKHLLVATKNIGKVEELASLIGDLAVEWLSLDDMEIDIIVEESGVSFQENAIIKALAYSKESGILTLADDSGLEVDALDGRPGVHTARYGGYGLTPRQRYELLLHELRGVPGERRSARFQCVVALAHPNGLTGTASGTCEGFIASKPKGSGGFGYDPVFYLPDQGLTMAQLSAAEKDQISHRGKAIAGIAPLIREEILKTGYSTV